MAYRREYYAAEAEDRGKVLSLDERARVPFGSSTKYYAKGVGPVRTISVSGGGDHEELVSFRRGR